jgi:hypothetical protein
MSVWERIYVVPAKNVQRKCEECQNINSLAEQMLNRCPTMGQRMEGPKGGVKAGENRAVEGGWIEWEEGGLEAKGAVAVKGSR